jgi:hypothetical protein
MSANFATGRKINFCTAANYFSNGTVHSYLSTQLLRANISLLFTKEEISQKENQMSATMCRKKVLLGSNEPMVVKSVLQTTQRK